MAAAWFDYDNDGLLDLIVDNYTFWTPQTDLRCTVGGAEYYCDPRRYQSVPSRLYHNLGHGKFEDVTEKSGLGASPGKGMGISIADFNNDGWPDIFIANDTEPNIAVHQPEKRHVRGERVWSWASLTTIARTPDRPWGRTPRTTTTTAM